MTNSMCGLFGFVSRGGQKPDGELLDKIAMLASRRGPDSWGYETERGIVRGMGKIPKNSASGAGATAFMLGHCRLSTMIGNKTIEAAQPIEEGGWVITHNGTIEQRWYDGINLRTGNDSEAIAHVINKNNWDVCTALNRISQSGSYAIAIRNKETGEITLAAKKIPLWTLVSAGVTYWCSIQPDSNWTAV